MLVFSNYITLETIFHFTPFIVYRGCVNYSLDAYVYVCVYMRKPCGHQTPNRPLLLVEQRVSGRGTCL